MGYRPSLLPGHHDEDRVDETHRILRLFKEVSLSKLLKLCYCLYLVNCRVSMWME